MLINPAVDASHGDVATGNESRRVGLRYLAQQLLTCGPLVIVDLLLLLAVIAIARQAVIFGGGKIGLNLSACFLPMASGFLLISAELGLYPGIRLSPVEEFRRLSMAVTSIFAVWVVGMAVLSDGLSMQRCDLPGAGVWNLFGRTSHLPRHPAAAWSRIDRGGDSPLSSAATTRPPPAFTTGSRTIAGSGYGRSA